MDSERSWWRTVGERTIYDNPRVWLSQMHKWQTERATQILGSCLILLDYPPYQTSAATST